MIPHQWTLAEGLKAVLDSGTTFTLHVTFHNGMEREFSLIVTGKDCMEVRHLHPEKGWQPESVFIRYDAIAMIRIEES